MDQRTNKIVGVIPARYGATRFPGKPLVPILGRPLLQWVIEGSQSSQLISEVLVATDDDRIARLAEDCGVQAVMTSPDLPSGSDRVYAAVKEMEVDIVVNIQGDEPLVTGELLDELVRPLLDDTGRVMSTLGSALREGELQSNNVAKIILNHRHEALIFSRFPIPYSRIDAPQFGGVSLKHIGLYAYRKHFLRRFCEHGPVALEEAEGLEQLRALYMGERIYVAKTEHACWGVDTPEDVSKVESMLKGAP